MVVVVVVVERVSNECRKTKTKVITLATQIENRSSSSSNNSERFIPCDAKDLKRYNSFETIVRFSVECRK